MPNLNAETFHSAQALGQSFTCSCGRIHETNLQDYVLEKDAIKRIPDLLRKYGAKRIFMVADINTMRVAGDAIFRLLEEEGDFELQSFVYNDEDLIPNDEAVEKLREAGRAGSGSDIWLAVGSGTLNDLTRFISHELGLPYLVFATAPSMDGYASGVSPLILNQMKQTFNAQSPKAILADPEILAAAPAAMIQAGAGDVFGKYTSLLDWQLGKLLFDEYYCPEIVAIVERSREAVASGVTAIRHRDPAAIRLLFDALVEVGIAMDYCGNSRPASGAEHHLAHFWEMQFIFAAGHPVLHGLEVGNALPLILAIYEQLAQMPADFDFTEARRRAADFDAAAWRISTEKAYGPAASEILKLSDSEALQSIDKRLARIDLIETKWPDILRHAKTAPLPADLLALYRELDFPLSPAALGVTDELVNSALNHAKDLRARYTILRLFEDLGIKPRNFIDEMKEVAK